MQSDFEVSIAIDWGAPVGEWAEDSNPEVGGQWGSTVWKCCGAATCGRRLSCPSC